MPEIRKDYLTGTWVVIAKERGKRPHDFKKPQKKEEAGPKICPFCPGNEKMTPPEINAYRNNGGPQNSAGWHVRCIPNKFPALRIEGDVDHRVSQLWNRMNGVGAHEVVVETADHDRSLAQMSRWEVSEVIHMYKERYNDLTGDLRFKYMLIFKNHGKSAGASLAHPHSQLIATPMIPRRIMDELNHARHYYHITGGKCIYDEIIISELEEQSRIIMENDSFVALSPYAARFPFETWLIPKHHDPSFEDLDDQKHGQLAEILHGVLNKLYNLLDDPDYNYYIHTAPCDRNDYRFYHWHIEITPRLTHIAGFERGTGFYINPLPPEDAARFLREAPIE